MTVSREQLEQVAGKVNPSGNSHSQQSPEPSAEFKEVLRLLEEKHGVTAQQAGEKYILSHCPFDKDHSGGTSVVLFASGGFKCYRCENRHWGDVLKLLGIVKPKKQKQKSNRQPANGVEETLSPEEEAEAAARGDDHAIAQDLFELMKEYIVFPDDGPLYILAVYVLHTHSAKAAYYTGYIYVCSAEKNSGKTRVLIVLRSLVRNPVKTENISSSALARIVEDEGPSMLIDELDTVLGPKANKETAETIRGILNSGYEQPGTYVRMVGTGSNQQPHKFPTYCPKVLAGLGSLPETTASRSIPLRIRRARQCKRFRPGGISKASRELDERLKKLRVRAKRWAECHLQQLADTEPDYPAEFSDRQCDNSEALLGIAQILGDPWPDRIKTALRSVFGSIAAEDDSMGVLLLGHVRKVFLDKEETRLYTKDLIADLHAIPESPWKTWNKGAGLNDRGLANLLKDYEIKSTTIRVPGVKPLKGYKQEDFEDSFQRLLRPVCKCATDKWDCDCHEACDGNCEPPAKSNSAGEEETPSERVN